MYKVRFCIHNQTNRGTNVKVLILNNGKPVVLGEAASKIPSILTAHYAGQQTGTAAAEILFGKTNPEGDDDDGGRIL